MTDTNPRDVNGLPQLTPKQMRNLKDLTETYRNHLGLNDSMPKLSPATKAVLDAAYRRIDENPHNEVEATIAAALRATADQVVPAPRLPYDSCCDVNASAIRTELLAIAAELEAQ